MDNNRDILKKRIKDGEVCGIFLFRGEEEYTKSYSRRRLIELAGGADSSDCSRLHTSALTDGGLEEALETCPSEHSHRYVEVEGPAVLALNKDKKAEVTRLLTQSEDVCAVIYFDCTFEWDKTTDKDDFVKSLRSHKGTLEVEFPRQSPSELTRWICSQAKSAGASIAERDAKRLADCCSCDMFRIAGEIEKLAAYSGGEITEEHIALIVTSDEKSGSFELSNAVSALDWEKALSALERLREAKVDSTVALYELVRCLKGMQGVLASQGTGLSVEEWAKLAGVHPYPAKLALTGAKKLGEGRLLKAVLLAGQADTDMKSTGQDGYDILRTLIIRLKNL
ncbi:MAG: DNA polymerase III subunit delta [Eubacteriales bacterium]